MSVFYIRQNPHALKSKDFMNFIKVNEIVSCPYGHSNKYVSNIENGIYNNDANNQDKRFVEQIKKGDYLVIPIEGEKKFILKKVKSNRTRFKTFKSLFKIKNKDGDVIKILNQDNITDDIYKKYFIELMRMCYKKCENLGVYNYEEINFPSNSFGRIRKETSVNYIRQRCNI